jgi:hypothetical protein
MPPRPRSTPMSSKLRAALSGHADAGELSAEDRAVFLDSFWDALARPLSLEEAFWAERRRRGGGVGLDERGRLVQAMPGGRRKPLPGESPGQT